MTQKNVLVLGGAGYIGSHTCLALKEAGYTPIAYDNLSRGDASLVKFGPLERGDILDTRRLTEVMQKYQPAAVIDFAALIEVGESVKNPLHFYENNVTGTLSVLKAMHAAGVKHIVFSSTAAVYGEPKTDGPLTEDLPLAPINPYGNTKLAAERMIRDAEPATGISSVCLRYFNACGAADISHGIGEPHYPETHLIPLVVQTALGMRPNISVFGTNYPTEDGTCIRDYIHVRDLADAHVLAVKHLEKGGQTTACNLGTGTGFSVREIINKVKEVSGVDFPVIEAERREGDPTRLVANNTKAAQVLGWAPTRTLDDIVESAHQWHKSPDYKAIWEGKKAAATAGVVAMKRQM